MEKKVNYKEAITKWLATDPSDQDLKQVYDVTFRREIAKLKKERRQLESKLKKFDRTIDELSDISQKPWDELKQERNDIAEEIQLIINELDKYEQPKKKKKDEKAKEAA